MPTNWCTSVIAPSALAQISALASDGSRATTCLGWMSRCWVWSSQVRRSTACIGVEIRARAEMNLVDGLAGGVEELQRAARLVAILLLDAKPCAQLSGKMRRSILVPSVIAERGPTWTPPPLFVDADLLVHGAFVARQSITSPTLSILRSISPTRGSMRRADWPQMRGHQFGSEMPSSIARSRSRVLGLSVRAAGFPTGTVFRSLSSDTLLFENELALSRDAQPVFRAFVIDHDLGRTPKESAAVDRCSRRLDAFLAGAGERRSRAGRCGKFWLFT